MGSLTLYLNEVKCRLFNIQLCRRRLNCECEYMVNVIILVEYANDFDASNSMLLKSLIVKIINDDRKYVVFKHIGYYWFNIYVAE